MAPYKSYKFPYYDLAMIGLESYMVQSMIGLESYMVQSMISLESKIFVANVCWRDMQPKEKFSNIENSQLYKLRATEPLSTFCICEQYTAGQNYVKL